MRKAVDVENIALQIRSLASQASNVYNTGYISWGYKQDLYILKEIIDNALAESPNFSDIEEQWLKEREQQRIIKLLKQG